MARRRDRLADVLAADGPVGLLPADLAAGPDPAIWCPDPLVVPSWMDDRTGRDHLRRARALKAWSAAGVDWSRAHDLGDIGWRDLLPADVAYAVSSLGRMHARSGDGYRPPWESR